MQDHPFDDPLAGIDPAIRRFTTEDIAGLGDDIAKISLLTVTNHGPSIIDLNAHAAAGGRVRLAAPANMPAGSQYAMVGTGVGAGGVTEPFTLSAEPCHCPSRGRDGRHWNPLCLAVLWHENLVAAAGAIVLSYAYNVADNPDRYCLDGVPVFLAAYRRVLALGRPT